jgi:putative transposase
MTNTTSPASSTTVTAASQYVGIRYGGRLAEAAAVTRIGSKGDSCDNTAAESIQRPHKTELIYRRRTWQSVGGGEIATLEWVDWFSHGRLHSACGDIPPVEYEREHSRQTLNGAADGLTEVTGLELTLR